MAKETENIKNEKIDNEMPDVESVKVDDNTESEENTDVNETEVEALSDEERLEIELEKARQEIDKQKNEYLFLRAEFDNFRKRTLKEKSELLLNGGERAFKGLLPVIDDFERAIAAIQTSNDVESVKEGINLIYNKFIKYLNDNGVKKIQSKDAEFNTDFHEAMTLFPIDDEDKKRKVIDVIEEGYTMNDKVIRHAKVVVGQ